MYIPAEFRVTDQASIHDLMERFSFATLVTGRHWGRSPRPPAGRHWGRSPKPPAGSPTATHLPIVLDREAGKQGRLRGHVARANPQWEDFGNGEALVIFQGDHGYISPSWYATHPSVPTWNYLAVHAYGVPRVIEDEDGVRAVLRDLVAKHEAGSANPWSMDLPEPYLRMMTANIVAFEMPITRLQGKFKLSQNRPREDQLGVMAALAASGDPGQRALAAVMRSVLGGEGRQM